MDVDVLNEILKGEQDCDLANSTDDFFSWLAVAGTEGGSFVNPMGASIERAKTTDSQVEEFWPSMRSDFSWMLMLQPEAGGSGHAAAATHGDSTPAAQGLDWRAQKVRTRMALLHIRVLVLLQRLMDELPKDLAPALLLASNLAPQPPPRTADLPGPTSIPAAPNAWTSQAGGGFNPIAAASAFSARPSPPPPPNFASSVPTALSPPVVGASSSAGSLQPAFTLLPPRSSAPRPFGAVDPIKADVAAAPSLDDAVLAAAAGLVGAPVKEGGGSVMPKRVSEGGFGEGGDEALPVARWGWLTSLKFCLCT